MHNRFLLQGDTVCPGPHFIKNLKMRFSSNPSSIQILTNQITILGKNQKFVENLNLRFFYEVQASIVNSEYYRTLYWFTYFHIYRLLLQHTQIYVLHISCLLIFLTVHLKSMYLTLYEILGQSRILV